MTAANMCSNFGGKWACFKQFKLGNAYTIEKSGTIISQSFNQFQMLYYVSEEMKSLCNGRFK